MCGRAVPVIAAGGVYTGADIMKFLDLGASGVQMGTRFVATHECDADDRFKQSYLTARDETSPLSKARWACLAALLKTNLSRPHAKGRKKPFKCVFHCVHTCEQEKNALLHRPGAYQRHEGQP